MDFYESISEYYDRIFPTDPDVLSLLGDGTPPAARILDVACGTGGYSIPLARRGHRVTGIDLDRAMIRAARSKSADLEMAPDFRVLDMLSMRSTLDPGFDLIFCIGNSLVHLQSDEQIERVLSDCRFLLQTNGRLVLQIINYDRVLEKGLSSLPTLRDDQAALEFRRSYRLLPGGRSVLFRTELLVGEDREKRVIRKEIPLRIVTSRRLTALLSSAGFGSLELFGGFGGQAFSLESLPLVVRARPAAG
jgi:SAM-dependent methyltransferase